VTNRLTLALPTAVIAIAAFAGVTLATPGVGVTNTTIATGNLPATLAMVKTGDWKLDLRTKGDSDVIVTESVLLPGATFGWHSHPGPSLVVVKSGTLSFYRGDDPTCTAQVYQAGDVFIDPGNVVHIGRNEGSVNLDVITTRLIPDGATARIDQPDPGNCSF
jgi:quercetin dioxygenase-like cupin family protein